jgi:3-hydroxyisobutyrate dehydrogenase-like beta-hydroxyacid dehydrogenase
MLTPQWKELLMQSENQQRTTNNVGGKLGFIGLGYMGSRIAKRLLGAGYPLVVFNRNRAKAEALGLYGAETAASPGELASATGIILSCLADEQAVRGVYLGTGGVLDYAASGTIVIEMSTIAPETSQRLCEAGRERGIEILDVAISGSTSAAESGALTLFGGGEHDAFESVTSIFSPIAKQWFYMGPSGSGVAMKLAVNTLLGVGMQAIAEAVALGQALGLKRDLLFETLAKTAVVAPAHVGKLASAKANDYAPQFPVRLMNKDFRLIGAASARLGVLMPATLEAASVTAAESSSGVEEDFSAVIRTMEQISERKRYAPDDLTLQSSTDYRQ